MNDKTLMIVLGIGSTLLVMCLIILLLVLWRKSQGKAKSREINREVDANPVYGIYALNDEGEDIGVSEIRDTNVYYAM